VEEPARVSIRGAEASLVESFGISGLYGYRSISLHSEFAATILIAKNGSGKTTLLGALNAFLKAQFTRLSDLQFNYIHCRLRSIPTELRLTRNDLQSFLELEPKSELIRRAASANIPAKELFRFLVEDFEAVSVDRGRSLDDRIWSALMQSTEYSSRDVVSICEKLRAQIYGQNHAIANLYNQIKLATKDIEIVYLPTYRRIRISKRRLADWHRDGLIPPPRRVG
jgi:predicted ATP-dependent endonuclease of OLD family